MGTEKLLIGDNSDTEHGVDEIEESMQEVVDMKVEEHVEGIYACPEFIFSKEEDKRIYKPWRRGVVVKLLGRRIG